MLKNWETSKKIIAMLLVLMMTINIVPITFGATALSYSALIPSGVKFLSSNLNNITVSFAPGYFPAESIAQDGDTIAFNMLVTAVLDNDGVLLQEEPPPSGIPEDNQLSGNMQNNEIREDEEEVLDDNPADYVDKETSSDSDSHNTKYDIPDPYEPIDNEVYLETLPSDASNLSGLFDSVLSLAFMQTHAADSVYSVSESEKIELWWYQDGVRRADKGASYVYAAPLGFANETPVDLQFDAVSPTDAGVWTLRAYIDSDFTQSPYVLNLMVEPVISIMPLSGTVHYVGEPQELTDAWNYSGDITIVLTDSFQMASNLNVGNRHVTIISDGYDTHILTAAVEVRHFLVPSNGELTLGVFGDTACAGNNFILAGGAGGPAGGSAPNVASVNGGSIEVSSLPSGQTGIVSEGGRLNMWGGTIRNNSSTGMGGAIHLGNNATFNMHGGLIADNTAVNGGGVSVQGTTSQGVIFNMHGGEISDNTATGTATTGSSPNGGGGVLVQGANSVFTMYDGAVIRDNHAYNGGGVAIREINRGVHPGVIFNMQGGTIVDNTSVYIGGGVFLGHNTSFNMYGGTIAHNTAEHSGGGVASQAAAGSQAINGYGVIFNMYSGEIAYNTALASVGLAGQNGGGGVLLQGISSVFTMHDGAVIRNNYVPHVNGGGILIRQTDRGGRTPLADPMPTLIMHGGLITENFAKNEHSIPNGNRGGGGIFMANNARLTMYDGARIYRNRTYSMGGGILGSHGSTTTGVIITMYGGEISHNETRGLGLFNAEGARQVAPHGGGVILQGQSTFTMHNGSINNNTSVYGGGVRLTQGAHFIMNGGTMHNNHSTTSMNGIGGSAVHLGPGSPGRTIFEMHDGAVVRDNWTNGNGGAIASVESSSSGSTIIMHGGEIFNNSSLQGIWGGGAIFLGGVLSSFHMYDGTIRDNYAAVRGGGVYIRQGSFEMNNGNIINNFATGTGGGGIHLHSGTTFNMYNGLISNNRTLSNGGGISTSSTAPGVTINMSGTAEISNNQAAGNVGGGGVFLQGATSEFTMTGGNIHGNRSLHGGGVRVSSGQFIMSGGAIHSNNTNLPVNDSPSPLPGDATSLPRSGRGGGVMLNGENSSFILSGNAAIRDNVSGTNGGGVIAENSSSFTMTGGEIYNNTSHSTGSNHGGGGVFVMASTFDMDGGEITNNNANRGGGVFVSRGSFNMQSGTIGGNTATVDGGGVWIGTLAAGASINMTGGEIINNTAVIGDGGGIFANPTETAFILPLGAYPNIIAAGGVFDGNTAGGGLFERPGNYSAFSFGTRLTNYNINYRTTWRITFDLNGGLHNGNPANIVFDVQAITGQAVGTSNVPSPITREGYTFVGWRHPDSEVYVEDEENGETELAIRTREQVGVHVITSSTMFIAQWERIPYTVTFDITYGTGTTPATQTVNGGEFATEPSSAAIAAITPPLNHEFVGWYTAATGDTRFDFANTPITANITLYARWTPIYPPLPYKLIIRVVDIYDNLIPTASVTFNGVTVIRQANGYWVATFDNPTGGTAEAAATGFISNSGTVLTADFIDNIAELTIVLIQDDEYEPGPGNNNPGTGNNNPGTDDNESDTDDNGSDSGSGSSSGSGGGTGGTSTQLRESSTTDSYSRELGYYDLGIIPPQSGFHARFMIGYPDGNFIPQGFITRAEVAAVLVRTMTTQFGVNVPRAQVADITDKFRDVSPGAWYTEYIAIAYSYGLIQGLPDGTFRPNAAITREQFAAMLARTSTIRTGGVIPYTDAANISYWAVDYVYTALATGLMHGDIIGTFRPAQPISREEAAAAFNRILGRGDTTSRSIEGVPDIIIFPDAANRNRWSFYYVLEATNSHWYFRDGNEEIWTEVVIYD